jgi:hypothetical protein
MKLTKKQIEFIKLNKGKITQISLANKFKVSLSTIRYHQNPKTRKYVIQKAKSEYHSLSPERKKQRNNKQREYLTNYIRNRLKNDKEFKRKFYERNRRYATNRRRLAKLRLK